MALIKCPFCTYRTTPGSMPAHVAMAHKADDPAGETADKMAAAIIDPADVYTSIPAPLPISGTDEITPETIERAVEAATGRKRRVRITRSTDPEFPVGPAPVAEGQTEAFPEPIPVETVEPAPEPIPASGYRTREEWLLGAVDQMRPWMAEVGAPVGPVSVSIGWPGGRGSKVGVRGQCWMPHTVKDGRPAIFISPNQTAEDPVTLLGILLHEMNHAAGHWGHTGPFGETAADLGFLKPWTDSSGKNEALQARLAALAEKMGPLAHAAIDPAEYIVGTRRVKTDPQTGEPILDPAGQPPVQSTRMLRLSCVHCGYVVRTTRKWINVGLPVCPCGTTFQEDV